MQLPSSSNFRAEQVVDTALELSQVFDAKASSSTEFRTILAASVNSIVRFGVTGAIKHSLRLSG